MVAWSRMDIARLSTWAMQAGRPAGKQVGRQVAWPMAEPAGRRASAAGTCPVSVNCDMSRPSRKMRPLLAMPTSGMGRVGGQNLLQWCPQEGMRHIWNAFRHAA